MAKTVDTLLIEIQAETKKLREGLDGVNKKLDQTKKKSKGVGDALKSVTGILATLGAGILIGNIVNTIRTFEDLEATLRAVTGSAQNAALSFDLIREFTKRTTFQIEEVAQAFITLKQAGVVPTAGVLEDFGNFAAGMGKSITQLAQAAFNATTGEMEMLKQFGVIARQEGDTITVTFDGVTKTIERNGEAVIEFLRSIGAEKFPTAIAERADTLSGAISNLQDAISEFFVAIGEAGFGKALTDFSRQLSIAFNNAGNLAEAIGETLTMAFKIVTEPIMLVINNLKIFISLLVGASVATIISNIQGLVTIFVSLGTAIKNTTIFASAFSAITGNLKGIVAGLSAAALTYTALNAATEDTAESTDDLAEKSKKVEENVTVTLDPIKRLTGSVKELNKAFQQFKKPDLGIEEIVKQAGGINNVFDTLENDIRKFQNQQVLDLEKSIFGSGGAGMLRGTPEYIEMLGLTPVKFAEFREKFFDTVFGMTEEEFRNRMKLELAPEGAQVLVGALTEVTDQTDELNKSFEGKSAEFFQDQLKGLSGFLQQEFGLSVEEASQKLADFYDKAEEGDSAFLPLANAVAQASQTFTDEFLDALKQGESGLEAFKDFSDNIVNQIVNIFLQLAVVNKILMGIFGPTGFNVTGFELPTLAGGGAIQKGQPTVVGERGPEIFVPHTGGKILNNMNSNNAMGGSTVVVNQSVNFATGVQATVRNEVLQLMPQIADATKAAVAEQSARGGRYRGVLSGA